MALGRQLVDEEKARTATAKIRGRGRGPSAWTSILISAAVPRQARRHGLGDLSQIGVHGDGLAAARLGDQVRRAGRWRRCGPASICSLGRRELPSILFHRRSGPTISCRLFLIRWGDLVRQSHRIAFALLAVCDVLEDEEHSMRRGFPVGRSCARSGLKTRRPKAWEIVLDLEAFDRLVFPAALFPSNGEAPARPIDAGPVSETRRPRCLRLGDSEDRQEGLASRVDDRHVVLRARPAGSRIVVDDALGQLPSCVLLSGPRRALLADILDWRAGWSHSRAAGAKDLFGH